MKKCNFLKLSMLALIAHGSVYGVVPPPPAGPVPTLDELARFQAQADAKKAGWTARPAQKTPVAPKKPAATKQFGVSLDDLKKVKLKSTGILTPAPSAPKKEIQSSMESALGKMTKQNPEIVVTSKTAPATAPKPAKKVAPKPAPKPSTKTSDTPKQQSVALTASQKRIENLVNDINNLTLSILTTKTMLERRKRFGTDDDDDISNDPTLIKLNEELHDKKQLLVIELTPIKDPYNTEFLKNEAGEIDQEKADLFFKLNKRLIKKILDEYNKPWQEVVPEDDEWNLIDKTTDAALPENEWGIIDKDTLDEELQQEVLEEEIDLGLDDTQDMEAEEFIDAVKESSFQNALQQYSKKHDLHLFDSYWYLSE